MVGIKPHICPLSSHPLAFFFNHSGDFFVFLISDRWLFEDQRELWREHSILDSSLWTQNVWGASCQDWTHRRVNIAVIIVQPEGGLAETLAQFDVYFCAAYRTTAPHWHPLHTCYNEGDCFLDNNPTNVWLLIRLLHRTSRGAAEHVFKLLESIFLDVCGHIFQYIHSNNITCNFFCVCRVPFLNYFGLSNSILSFHRLFLSWNKKDNILLHISKSPRSSNTRYSRNVLAHLLIKWTNTNIIYCMAVRLRCII